MTNPNNSIGTNAAYGGRTSVNAFNDDLAAFSRGILSGWGCTPNTGLTVSLGGDGNNRDVAVAEDNIGDRTTINNISGSPVNVTLAAAPGSNSRIDAIVAYVDNPPQGSSTVADNPEACGIIAVSGTAAASPVAPTENTIRSAITADGASGTTAYYVVLAYITMAAGTTDIVADNITAGPMAKIASDNLDFTTMGDQASYIDFGTLRIQFGTQTGGKYNSNTTVTLPAPFAGTSYAVSAVNQFNESGTSRWILFLTGKTASSFTYRSGFLQQDGSTFQTNTGNRINWIAMGLKPTE